MKTRLRFARTLRARMSFTIAVLMVLAALVAMMYFVTRTANIEIQTQLRIGHGLADLEAPELAQLIAEDDVAGINKLLSEMTTDPAIATATIRDSHGGALYAQGHETQATGWLTRLLTGQDGPRTIKTGINLQDGGHGVMELTLADRPLNEGIRRLIVNSLLFLGALLLATIAIMYSLLKRFTAPLTPLTEMARQLSRGNWTPKIRLIASRSHELQELNQAFADSSATMRHYIHNLEETRELLEHSENRLRALVNGMREILFELDHDGHISFLNPAWEALTGFKSEDTLGRPFSDFAMERQVAIDFTSPNLPAVHDKNREICLRSAAGKRLWVHVDAEAQFDSAGRFTGVIGTLGDITRSVELNRLLTKYQDDLYYLSVTDPLTGLYNRRHFDTQLEVILTDHLPKSQSVCLLIVDLDGFKFINDTYGHPAGDDALRAMSGLLKKTVRRNDYVARLAGDEFAMVLKNTTLNDATAIAIKLHAAINETQISLPVGHIHLQCSIGVAEAPTHGRTAQDLVSAADVALYHSKRRGRNRVEVLSPDISRALMSIFSQGFQLRNALEQGNLMPAFQPICDIRTGLPIAYEALARMQHGGSTIKAADFIAVAEELGLTREIDLHIIEQALRLAPVGYGLFLNLDPSSFNDRGFVTQLETLIGPACRAGKSVVIEITERENVTITETLLADIQTLRRIGCKLALDDFGSGYSTYHFLNLFRPEYLKIEGTFVRGMLDHEADRKIVEHIHELAMSFGIETIAESVENEETRNALLRMGIRNAQGWHLGSPQILH
ncbi:MAG: putative bifunctional diguanylate cyclase/phosphodiesterase [Acidiferrobacterales bacterium]